MTSTPAASLPTTVGYELLRHLLRLKPLKPIHLAFWTCGLIFFTPLVALFWLCWHATHPRYRLGDLFSEGRRSRFRRKLDAEDFRAGLE